jgi:PDZ domain
MSGNLKRNTILGLTYFLLLVATTFVAARLIAWRHQGWTGLCYLPGANQESERKRLGWTPGGVTCTFAGSPAEAAGITAGDVVLAVNGVPAGDHQQLAQLDAQLKLIDEITYRIQHKDGSQVTKRMRLDSPLRSSQIQVSTFTGFGAALVFFALGSLVYWRKPEDRRALIFYLLSLVATICAATTPLLYVDVLAAGGARPIFLFKPGQALLWTAVALLEFTVLALVVHFSLIFPRPRRFVQRNPQALRWLYLAPLLDLITLPTFAMSRLLESAPRLGLAGLWILVLTLLGYLGKSVRSSGWKPALGRRPVSVLGTIALLVIGSTSTLLLVVPSKVEQGLIADAFMLLIFCVLPLAFNIVYSAIACTALYRSYRESGVEEKRQLRWPLWGTIVSVSGLFLMFSLGYILNFLGMEDVFPVIAREILPKAFYLIIPLCFAFAILKYRLMEIDLIIRKTIIYSIVSGIVVVLYLALVGGLGGLLLTRAGVHSTWTIVFATLATAAVFIPLRSKVQQIVDGRFFRRKEDLPRALRTLSLKTSETADLFVLLKLVAEHLVQVLKLRGVAIFSKSLREQNFQVAAQVGLADQVNQIRFARHTKLLVSEDIGFNRPGICRTPRGRR